MKNVLMSQKYPASLARFEPAMSFEEIGRALGIPKQTAYFFFVSGLRKIRRNQEACRRLLELYEAKEALRSIGRPMPDWNE